MTNELAVQQPGQLIAIPQVEGTIVKNEDKHDEMMASSKFLPRLQLYGGSTKECKQGLIGVGLYGIKQSKESVLDLGKVLEVLPIDYRMVAVDMSDRDEIIVNYDENSDEFKRIQKSMKDKDEGNFWGPQYLLWIPSVKKIVTWHLNNATSHKVSPILKGQRGKATTLKVEYIETKKYQWHGPIVLPSSQIYTDLPDPDDLLAKLTDFMNPKADEKAPSEEQVR